MIQAGLPAWLGYLSIGYSALAAAALVLFNLPAFYLLAPYYFITLVAGIILAW